METASGIAPARLAARCTVLLALLALLAGGGLVAGCSGGGDAPVAQAASAAPARTLELATADVVTAEKRVLARRLPISGSLTPLVQSQIKARVAGEVLAVTRREGEPVRRGELLVRIDTRSQEALVASQRAALEKARADLGIARLNVENSERLLAKKFIAQNVLDTQRSVYEAALAGVKLAEAQLRLAEIGLADAEVRAPFDAVVARRFAEPGEKVSSDSPLLELVDLSRLELQAAAPAADTPAIAAGQLARVRVDGFGERVFDARLERINPVTEQGSRQILLYLAIDNADRALRGGMFAQGELVIDRSEPVLAIPAAAVQTEAGVAHAWVIDGGVLERRQLALGAAWDAEGLVEVRSGLEAGARLVGVGIDGLAPGVAVTVTGGGGAAGPRSVAVAPGAGG